MLNSSKKVATYFLSGALAVSFGGIALAQHGHGHGGGSTSSSGGGSHSMSMKDRPVQSVTVDGYKITLDIMDMSMHTSMQTMKGNPAPGESDQVKSHAIMVVVQDTASKEIITDAKVTYKITGPSGPPEAGNLDWSGDHFGRGFNPKEKGAYQVQLVIESGGMEREAKFTYNL